MRILGMSIALALIAGLTSSCSSSSSAQPPTGVVSEALVPDAPFGVAVLDSGLIVFVPSGATSLNPEPWVTDGTPAGTFQLRETISGNYPGSEIPAGVEVGNIGRKVFEVKGRNAYFFTHFGDLWITDGTSDGTQMFADLSPDADVFGISSVERDGDDLYVGGCQGSFGVGIPVSCSILRVSLE